MVPAADGAALPSAPLLGIAVVLMAPKCRPKIKLVMWIVRQAGTGTVLALLLLGA